MNLSDFAANVESFMTILRKAQAERSNRQRFGPTGELEWVVFERETMFMAVHAKRAKMGKRPIGIDMIKRAERSASGHADYSSKFALYCAELAWGD